MLLMATAVADRVRIRPIRLMWYNRTFKAGYIASILFQCVVLGGIVYAGIVRDLMYLYLGLGYLAGSICWCAAMRLSSATLITDFVIVRHAGHTRSTICWSQVVDFFVRPEGNKMLYVFLYTGEHGERSRFELRVPKAYRHVFERMVYQNVEKKRMSVPEHAYG